MSMECAAAAFSLVEENLGTFPVKAVIYSHSHIDHFGGVRGIISEEDVHQLWDDICNKHIVPESNDTVDNIFFSLLTALGYLQSITIRKEDDPVAQNGFQLDAGRGRAFLIKGDLHDI